ncbi:hypothetical protein V5O48_007942 [Marasmius crinis-equi]|uniref:MARVEL domain-containing protein n=1 Tax=Marasmius crinis-equi TaxID=585013 RepID=A0ABR3FF94_9AGAR
MDRNTRATGFGNSALRRIGYLALALFSLVLLGLTATRIRRTMRLGFHERIIAELLAAACVALLWSLFHFFTIHRRREGGFLSTFRSEMISNFIPWILLLVGAAIATDQFRNSGNLSGISTSRGNLTGCNSFDCRLLTTIIAFAWITWSTLTLLMLTSALYSTVHSGWDEPMHARWAPRSGYGHNGYRDTKYAPAAVSPGGVTDGTGATTGPRV